MKETGPRVLFYFETDPHRLFLFGMVKSSGQKYKPLKTIRVCPAWRLADELQP